MSTRAPDQRRFLRRHHSMRDGAWVASALFHLAVGAAAWAVASPAHNHVSQLIGRSTVIELTATLTEADFHQPQSAREQTTVPVRIMPTEAEIARRHFRMESTNIAEPTPFEREWVAGMMASQAVPRQVREPGKPVLAAETMATTAQRTAVAPRLHQPGTVDRPLPELIESLPPTYPRIAIDRGWEGTVLLRLSVTAEGRVAEVEVLRGSGHGVLDGEAVRAVRTWRFVPAIHGGKPVGASIRLPVRFDLSAPPSHQLSIAP